MSMARKMLMPSMTMTRSMPSAVENEAELLTNVRYGKKPRRSPTKKMTMKMMRARMMTIGITVAEYLPTES